MRRLGLSFFWLSVFWLAVSVHVIQALALIADPAARSCTTLSDLSDVFYGATPTAIVLLLASVSAMAGMAVSRDNTHVRLLLLTPQQILMMIAMWSAAHAMWASAFADGVVRPRAFLIADQCPTLMVGFWHTLAVIGREVLQLESD